MTQALSNPAAPADRLLSAAQILLPHVLSGERIQRVQINAAMETAFDGRNAHGRWTQRDSFIALEIASILALRQSRSNEEHSSPIKALEHLSRQLPTQTVRSEEQIALQHFSTPPGLAWMVATLAAIQPDDLVLEPSAGTGMLAAWVDEVRGSTSMKSIKGVPKSSGCSFLKLLPASRMAFRSAGSESNPRSF
jgi:hypothetical protein